MRTEDEGGIGAAGKGSAEHGIHDLHLHFVDNAVGRPGLYAPLIAYVLERAGLPAA